MLSASFGGLGACGAHTSPLDHSLEVPGLLGGLLRAEVALGNPAPLLGQLNAQAFPSFPSCS